MGLTPDEIAHRAFTPSVDGYHQGEVRSFLDRIAAQLRSLQLALPEGRVELAEFTTTLQDREPHLAALQEQLHDMLAELTAATSLMKEAQVEATSQLSEASSQLAAEQRALLERLTSDQRSMTSHLEIVQKLTSEQREAADSLALANEQAAVQLATAQKLATEQREASNPLVAAGRQQVAQLEAAQRLTSHQAEAAEQLSAARDLAAQRLAEAATAASTASAAPSTIIPKVYTDPAGQAAPTSASRTVRPSDGTMSLFASDLDDQPMFSDNANDLLDGVLDDVMENINDEGDQS